MSGLNDWSRAYARQAQADFAAWNLLDREKRLAQSQKLHFLQMACEKLAKAHLCNAGSSPDDLQRSHAYIAKNLPIVVRAQISRMSGKWPKRWSHIFQHAKHLAREIELLAPSVDDGGNRPDNCEYPWDDGSGRVLVPAEFSFTALQLVRANAGRTFLKMVAEAISELARGDGDK